VAHKMPTTHVGCYRLAVLDGGSNPPISTKGASARQLAGRLRRVDIPCRARSVLAGFLHLRQRREGNSRLAWRSMSSPAAHIEPSTAAT
jgi:hypothetical protein